jgi:hypothetical protein
MIDKVTKFLEIIYYFLAKLAETPIFDGATYFTKHKFPLTKPV